MSIPSHDQCYNITYTDKKTGKRMACTVEVIIDIRSIVLDMGTRACESKTGKCQDGHVTVKRTGPPREEPT